MNIVTNMETLARKWHEGQFRKGPEQLPYIVHPAAVVNQLKEWGFSVNRDPVVLSIGWGHDLFEDTAVPASEVVKACGRYAPEVISGIAWLTFCPDHWPNAKSKETAKAMYIERVARFAPPQVLAVKLADRFCNLRDFANLHGKCSTKIQSYFCEAEVLFENIPRLTESIQSIALRTLAEIKDTLVFCNSSTQIDENSGKQRNH